MNRGIFICFTGIDGSGKTTLANITIDKIKKFNTDCSYVYCGWRQFESPILKPIILSLKSILKSDHENKKININNLKYKNNILFKLLLFLDYYYIVSLRLTLSLVKGKIIVCDRYFYDMLINTGLDLNKSDKDILFFIKIFRPIFPKPNLIFLVDVPISISYKRKNDIPYEGYLSDHRRIFLKMAEELGIIVIDGALPIEQLSMLIENYINQLMVKKL